MSLLFTIFYPPMVSNSRTSRSSQQTIQNFMIKVDYKFHEAQLASGYLVWLLLHDEIAAEEFITTLPKEEFRVHAFSPVKSHADIYAANPDLIVA